VATTSLFPPLKVPCANGDVRLCKFADRFTRRRCSNHGQTFCVAWKCAVLTRFSEHWRRWHSSDLRQRRTDRATSLRSCRLVYVDATFGWCVRYFISYLRSSSSILVTRYNKLEYYTWSTPFGFPYIPFPAFSSPAVWCRVSSPTFLRPCIFDRSTFSSPAFSVHPVSYGKKWKTGTVRQYLRTL